MARPSRWPVAWTGMPTTLHLTTRYDESRNANVVSFGDGGEIWWQVPGVSSLGSMRMNDDFAAAAALPVAMKNGVDIYLDGSIDRRLAIALEKYSCAWAQWKPGLYHPVRIEASEILDYRPDEGVAGSVVALSGGVDSTFVLHALSSDERYRLFEPPAASITIRGFDLACSEYPPDDPSLVMTRQISDYFGVRNLVVRTNWNEYCVDYILFHPLGLAAAFHQFNAVYRAAYFAADYTYEQDYRVHPKGSSGTTNQFLGSPALPVSTIGARVPRAEKTLTLMKNEVLDGLVVPCTGRDVQTGAPCGRCRKCLYLDIFRFVRDRARVTPVDEWRLFLRIVWRLQFRGETTMVYSREIAQILKGKSRLLLLAIRIRQIIYQFRKLRRSLVTGRSIKRALGRLTGRSRRNSPG